jgi:hypothetical protein
MVILGNYLYVYGTVNGNIYKVDKNSGTVTTFVTGMVGFGFYLIIHDDFMYVSNYDGVISKIQMSNPSNINNNWITIGTNIYATDLAIIGNYLYVAYTDNNNTNPNNGFIGQYNLSDGSVVNATFISGLYNPWGLLVNGNYLYVTNGSDKSSIGQYELPSSPVPPASPTPTCYPYKPYLQPTPSLGSGARYAQAASIGPKPQIASANRIYSYYKRQNQGDAFYNQLFFSIYGVKR